MIAHQERRGVTVMGEGVSCCSQPDKPDLNVRELISLENGDACSQTMTNFLSQYPRMNTIFERKPNYCYSLDRSLMFERGDMVCIGNVPQPHQSTEMIVLYKEGYLYEGDLLDYKREGCGRMISAEGHCYEGKWQGNEPEGEGTYEEYSPRRKYTGHWSGGSLTGKGRACYEDGSVYEGDFYQNQRHGRGRIQYSNGTVYDGSFKANLMEGFGTMIGINHKYEGSWKGGKMEGGGKSYWYNQDDQLLQTYEGQYLNGCKHGKGQYRWSNGRVYQGLWEQGQIINESQQLKKSLPVKPEIQL